MKQTKKTGIILAAFTLIILMSSLTMAFGVAIPYWDSPEWYPLKLAPGESKIVELTLQNTGEKDMVVQADLTSDIAKLSDTKEVYSVPSGEINEIVSIEVKVPKDVEVGTRYKIYSTFKQISSGEGGMVEMTGALTINFPVEVVGEEESELFNPTKNKSVLPWIVLGALLIGMIAIAIVEKRKKQKKK